MTKAALAKLLSAMFLAGLLLFGYIILRPLPGTPSSTHREIDISTMKVGELRKIEDLDAPVWILRRTPEMTAALRTAVAPPNSINAPLQLSSENSDNSCQRKAPDFFVFVPLFEIVNLNNGVKTVLAVEEAGPGSPAVVEGPFPGGFKDNATKGLYFDYAGRLLSFKAQSYWLKSASNLFIPECTYTGKNKLLVNIEGVLSNIRGK